MKKQHKVHIDSNTCIGCGMCQKDCPAGNIAIVDKKAVVKTQTCIMCGHCTAICPKAAVSMTGFDEAPIAINEQTRLDPEQFLNAIRTRRTIRQFTSRTVAPEVIAQIIEAGRLTPSGGNAQEVSYLVLMDQIHQCESIVVRFFRRIMPLAKLVVPMAKNVTIDSHYFFKKAPVVILVLAKDKVDGALAAADMALAAEANGLGVLYSGFFTMVAKWSGSLRKALGFTQKDQVAMTLVIGYPSVTYRRTVQKEAAVIRQL